MKRSIKLVILTILLQLLCFGSYSQTNNDSIKISVNDVKIINQKLVDAKLVSEQLDKAKQLIENYKVENHTLEREVQELNAEIEYVDNKYKKNKQWKHFWCGTTAGCSISILLLILCL